MSAFCLRNQEGPEQEASLVIVRNKAREVGRTSVL